MQQIKIFKGLEHDLAQLEADVNQWLVANNVQVISIFGNMAPQSQADTETLNSLKGGFAPSDMVIVILYDRL